MEKSQLTCKKSIDLLLIGRSKLKIGIIVLLVFGLASRLYRKEYHIARNHIFSKPLIKLERINILQRVNLTPIAWKVEVSKTPNIPILYTLNALSQIIARPWHCNGCMDVQYSFLVNNEDLCAKHQNYPYILILIVSAPKNALRRNVLRATWLTYTKQNTGDTRYVFLLGSSSKDDQVQFENSRTKDIILGNFSDSYSTMALKTLMGFKWMEQYCQKTKYIVKTDDDVYINIPGLRKTINEHAQTLQRSIAGHCMFDVRPHRHRSSKYYVSKKSYPQDTYPDICVGNGILASKNVISDIVNISKNVPYIYLDDVYIGLCLKAIGYKVKHLKGFALSYKGTDQCRYKKLNAVTVHECTIDCLKGIWNNPCNLTKTVEQEIKTRKTDFNKNFTLKLGN